MLLEYLLIIGTIRWLSVQLQNSLSPPLPKTCTLTIGKPALADLFTHVLAASNMKRRCGSLSGSRNAPDSAAPVVDFHNYF